MKAPCLICQKNVQIIEVMTATIERLLKEKAIARNEALEEAGTICRAEIQAGIKANDDQWMVCADLLRTKILDLKEQK